MTAAEITKLPLGSMVFLIHEAKIEAWETLGFHPKYNQYFYLCGNGSISKTKTLFTGSSEFQQSVWETDYDKARQIMWEQLKKKIYSINMIYMEGKESLNFEI